MAVTLHYEDGKRAVFESVAEALDQAAHDENVQARKAVEITDGAVDPTDPEKKGKKVAGRAEVNARVKEREER